MDLDSIDLIDENQSKELFKSIIALTLPPALIMPEATTASSGPHPATTVLLPGKTRCDFNKVVEAAKPITPGKVQPGNGIILS